MLAAQACVHGGGAEQAGDERVEDALRGQRVKRDGGIAAGEPAIARDGRKARAVRGGRSRAERDVGRTGFAAWEKSIAGRG